MGHNDQSQIIESLDCEMIVATYVHVGVCICRCGAKIGNIHMGLAIGSEEPGDSANSCSLRNEARRSGARVAKCAT